MRRKDWSPNRNAVLCSKHFSDACYETGGRLKKGSVPTEFKFEGFEQVMLIIKYFEQNLCYLAKFISLTIKNWLLIS